MEVDAAKAIGAALAIGLGACLNAGLLYYKLRSQNIYQPQPGWTIFLLKILAALLVLGVVLWFTSGTGASWLADTAATRASRLAAIISIGAGSYFATLWLLGFRIKDFYKQQIE